MVASSFLYDTFQYLIVGALVTGCSIYCVLALAPNAIKEPLRRSLRRLPLPQRLSELLNQTRAAGTCGSSCGGCSASSAPEKKVLWLSQRR
jgi:hypothetical protein